MRLVLSKPQVAISNEATDINNHEIMVDNLDQQCKLWTNQSAIISTVLGVEMMTRLKYNNHPFFHKIALSKLLV